MNPPRISRSERKHEWTNTIGHWRCHSRSWSTDLLRLAMAGRAMTTSAEPTLAELLDALIENAYWMAPKPDPSGDKSYIDHEGDRVKELRQTILDLFERLQDDRGW